MLELCRPSRHIQFNFGTENMESLYFRFCAIVLLCVPGILAGCKEDLQQDSGVMECMMGFSQFFQSAVGSIDPNDKDLADNIMKLFCSDEGKSAFNCVLGYMSQCPELMSSGDGTNPLDSLSSMTGVDAIEFFKEGGLDGYCALMIGPCSQVKTCYEMPMSGGVAKRQAPTQSYNNYLMFMMQAGQLCGSMKSQMACMIEKLADCPDSVISKVESEFENAIKMAMPDALGIVSFKDTKDFLNTECDHLAKKSTQDQEMCVKGVMTNPDFMECSKNITEAYDNGRNCLVYGINKACVMEYLTEECGEEAADFYIRNAHFIWPGIPRNCAMMGDPNSGIVVKMSSGVILMSLLAFLITSM